MQIIELNKYLLKSIVLNLILINFELDREFIIPQEEIKLVYQTILSNKISNPGVDKKLALQEPTLLKAGKFYTEYS